MLKKTSLRIALLFLAGVLYAGTGPGLIDAVKSNDIAAVRSLLASKVDVNAAAADSSTALHWAVQNDNLEIASLLIGAGAQVNAATRYNITPLSLACTNGSAAMIQRLLEAGVDANSTSEEGQTALMTAALNGKVDAIKVLLSHGAKLDTIEPYKGQTALMWAAGEGNSDAAADADRVRRQRQGRSPRPGYTPLLFAVLNNRIAVAKTLLEHGANIGGQSSRRHHGAEHGHRRTPYYDMASVLLDYKADPNAPDPRTAPRCTR